MINPGDNNTRFSELDPTGGNKMSRSQSYGAIKVSKDVNNSAYTKASMRHQKEFDARFPYAKVTEEAHESDGEEVIVH